MTPGDTGWIVGFSFAYMYLLARVPGVARVNKKIMSSFSHPFSPMVTSSRQITEVKQRRARLVRGCVTAALVTLSAMCKGVGQAFHITPPLSTKQ